MGICRLLARLSLALALAGPAAAQEFKPALVYDLGGASDGAFNEAARAGAERFKAETGVDYRAVEIEEDGEREQALRDLAQRGHSPIIAIGLAQADALDTVAQEFPKTQFAIVDMVVERPNVRSIVFKEHEGSYLIGMLAALASQSGKIGFVGGIDVPLIRKFACGYAQGAKAARPEIQVFESMAGTTGAAWNDPAKGSELARSQLERGADVVYHAAGGTGLGVLQAAADAGKLGIGANSNQNGLHPGAVLTSMVKGVDVAVHDVLAQAQAGEFAAGLSALGLAEGGVSWALDDHNEARVTDEMEARVDAAAEKIRSGEIEVHDYTSDSSCPVS
jgi:basic membrane protein A